MKKRKITPIDSKKGMTSLEIIIAVLVVVVIICGFVDLTTILQRTNSVSQNTAYISRVVGSQGGVRTTQIDNFAGTYVTSDDLYRSVKRSMNSSGIEDDDWEVTINGNILNESTNVPLKDYGSRMKIQVSVDYKWGLTSNYVPGDLEGTTTSSNEVFTTHKIRDGNFEQKKE